MKLFAFIMAFLVLGLSILPCADECFGMKVGKAIAEITPQHGQQQEHKDDCSPFCYCTCCAGFSVNYYVAAVSSPEYIDCKLYSSFLPGNLIKYSSPIWQPPQL